VLDGDGRKGEDNVFVLGDAFTEPFQIDPLSIIVELGLEAFASDLDLGLYRPSVSFMITTCTYGIPTVQTPLFR
jgi:hypothetical protein